jgi:hypothetical protein
MMRRASALCEICGIKLSDSTERFCGGDRCLRVFGRHVLATAEQRLPRIGIV